MSDSPNDVEFGRRATPPAPGNAAKPASEALRQDASPSAAARRSRHSRNRFVVFFNLVVSLCVLGALAAFAGLWFGKYEFNAEGPTAETQTFLVKPKTGLKAISNALEENGIITNSWVFQLGAQANGKAADLKAGEYEIKPGASMREIMDLMASGKSILYSITIPEGLTVEQALQKVSATPELSGDLPTAMPAEGSLAADTQRFTRGTERKAIVDKMLADQKALVEEIWAKREDGLPLKNIDEFVTLASIVEKETGIADERPQVAAVFINRLNKGMRLQSDPTILYGLFGGKGRPADRPIFQSDIQKPTPYNTYVIDGLPPTPIANPGRAALEAVANPAKTKDLYFVASGGGGHVFAETLEQHNKNVARWREIQKQQGQPADAPQQQ
ncbi:MULTISPECIES: endolytic transglycosylase MltG [Mesorhizobium]|uniref:Endolytic murein transglycosylase n=1 Tax=Mesorhizobium denitrificans TaxID=2294114 RepID=A0A371XIY2_9HYPH|nr:MULTISPECIES: endolytic transglycosylase MltG [Mesorhizobium]RFC69173.1 endolytic transglycosylase MltG [Mesorhizobium denitrificans]